MNKNQLRDLIRRVLKDVDLYSESAEELLMLTAATESNLGTYISQIGGPAKGIFQMEPNTANDIWANYISYRSKIYNRAREVGYFSSATDQPAVDELEYSLAYQIIMARIHYLRVPCPLPPKDDVNGLAAYWKKYYNTRLGKGTVDKAIQKYNKYVVGE